MRVRPCPKRRDGFATFMAVVMISLVAMSLLALTLLFRADARRTRRHHAQAQLRELLHAGADAAEDALTGRVTFDTPLPLTTPPTIEDAELRILYQQTSPDTVIANIQARLGRVGSYQRVTFTDDGAGYRPLAVELSEHR